MARPVPTDDHQRTLHAGLARPAALLAAVPLLLLVLPREQPLRPAALAACFAAVALLAGLVRFVARGPERLLADPRLDLTVVILANVAIVALAAGVHDPAVPTATALIAVQLYHHASRPSTTARVVWGVGVAAHLAAQFLAGAEALAAVARSLVFAAVSAAVALAVGVLGEQLQRLVRRQSHLAELARVTSAATTLDDGIRAGRAAIVVLAGAEAASLEETLADPEPAHPGDEWLALGYTARGVAWLRLERPSSASGTATVVHLLKQLCERERLTADLARVALTDPLTGMPTRGVLDQLVADSSRMSCGAVVMLELDGLAEQRRADREAADEGLRRFAALLNRDLRLPDVATQLAGGRFCVLVHGTVTEATRLVDRLRAAWHASGGAVTISAGVAAVTDQLPMSASTLASAERALARAQQVGSDRTEVEPAAPGGSTTSAEALPVA
jgi:diguanylate cyclase (GGDEF)-like protein